MSRPGLFNENFHNPERYSSTSRYPESAHSKIPSLVEDEAESQKSRSALQELLKKKDELKRSWEGDEMPLLEEEYRLNKDIVEKTRDLEKKLATEIRDLEIHVWYPELADVIKSLKSERTELEILRQELETDSEDVIWKQVKLSNQRSIRDDKGYT